MNVEWDPAKNRANFRKHGINFEQVKAAFDNPARIDDYDDRDYGENRWAVVGMVGSAVVHVAYTIRNGDVRLISARKAAAHEQARYFSGTQALTPLMKTWSSLYPRPIGRELRQ